TIFGKVWIPAAHDHVDAVLCQHLSGDAVIVVAIEIVGNKGAWCGMAERYAADNAAGLVELLGPLREVPHWRPVRIDTDRCVVGPHAGGQSSGRGGRVRWFLEPPAEVCPGLLRVIGAAVLIGGDRRLNWKVLVDLAGFAVDMLDLAGIRISTELVVGGAVLVQAGHINLVEAHAITDEIDDILGPET